MDIQMIGSSSYSVYISNEELRLRGMSADSDSCESFLTMLIPYFRGGKLHAANFELLEGRDDVLIFIRLNFGDPSCFSFDEFEDLASAICFCPNIPSSLIKYENKYLLIVYPWPGESVPPSLFEFGTYMSCSLKYEAFLKEHGDVIISKDAVPTLQHYFCKHI